MIKEIFSILAILIATFLAFILFDNIGPFIQEFLNLSMSMAQILAFTSIFLIGIVVFNLLIFPISKLAQIFTFKPLDKISGAIFGIMEGTFITGVVLASMSASKVINRAIESSLIARPMVNAVKTIFSAIFQ